MITTWKSGGDAQKDREKGSELLGLRYLGLQAKGGAIRFRFHAQSESKQAF
jgi:hypothetical protein